MCLKTSQKMRVQSDGSIEEGDSLPKTVENFVEDGINREKC